MPHMWKNL
ncbi:hypothetical protein CIB84_016116 [Bambusicola thoracicus]|uniref:Uncharacterized protein n=1 Tax=Bambusicola thoracicus TaxID=9083 RepID=A0A2P4S7R7_BAMTH|nr:hypothetical protein CIB84_016116 [Bambusicola thoracicus]